MIYNCDLLRRLDTVQGMISSLFVRTGLNLLVTGIFAVVMIAMRKKQARRKN